MPCFRPRETDDISCEQRLSEIAAILARGVLRLRAVTVPKPAAPGHDAPTRTIAYGPHAHKWPQDAP